MASKAYALSGSNLIQFDPANPTVGTTTAITGVTAGDVLVGIDFRPINGMLYGLGVNDGVGTATLYAISTRNRRGHSHWIANCNCRSARRRLRVRLQPRRRSHPRHDRYGR